MIQSKSEAPALDYGLALIEHFAEENQPQGVSEISRQTGINKGTAQRLLSVLVRRGYLLRDDERCLYRPSDRLMSLKTTELLADKLRRLATPLMRSLTEEVEHTTILFLWKNNQIECLAKCNFLYSLSMQEVGNKSNHLMHSPWGWIFLTTLPASKWSLFPTKTDRHSVDPKRVREQVARYEKQGFAYDNQMFFKTVRRIAVPIMDREHSIVGALALGGFSSHLAATQVKPLAERLLECAHTISQQL